MLRPTDGESWGEYLNRLIDQFFPERQIVLRTEGHVRYFCLGKNLQLAIVAGLIVAGSWSGYSTVNVFFNEAILAEKNTQVASARLAYRSLLTEVAEYQNKFGQITKDLEESHAMMLGLVEQNASLQQNLKTVETRLKSTEQERETVSSAREILKDQLGSIESRMHEMASHNFELRDDLTKYEADLQKTLSERNRLVVESNQMRDSIKRLETRLSNLQNGQTDAVQRLGDQALNTIESYESVVEMTGLPVETLIDLNQGKDVGMGGPFVEAVPDNLPAAGLRAELTSLNSKLDRVDALQTVVAKVPLAAPLDSFYVTSSFGKRRDPMNKRWAMHYGLDMGGAMKSPVYSTAPGIVTYAGWKGNYGRYIEIDHGSGIKTRYGHLHKILVKKGDKVKFRDRVGLLGSSGRSTGAHLHYEVVFQGKPHNPMKFIKAGRYVFQE